MRFDPTYRVMVYSERVFQIGNTMLTRDDVARMVGWVSPQVLRNTVKFCNAQGLTDLRQLASYTPEQMQELGEHIGQRTVYGIARILNALAPNVLRGAKAEWRIENAAPLTPEEIDARAARVEQAKKRYGQSNRYVRRGKSPRFGHAREAPSASR